MQRKVLLLSALLLACGGNSDPEAAADPTTSNSTAQPSNIEPEEQAGFLFESELGRYSVRFPSEPRTQVEKLGTLPDGKTLNIEITMHEERSGLTLGATLTQVPPFPEERIQSALDDGVQGAVANVPGAQLDSVEHIEINGHSGRKFKMHGAVEGLSFEGQQMILYKPGALVQFMSIAPQAQKNHPSIQTFFDSIEHR